MKTLSREKKDKVEDIFLKIEKAKKQMTNLRKLENQPKESKIK